MTSLYRHFASDGSLLYIGISLSWPERTKAHAQKSRWFDLVARVEIENYPDRDAALKAEREAIQREKPKFNVVHNSRKQSAPIKSAADPKDPVLAGISGPTAFIGPAKIYQEGFISVMVAHGVPNTEGALTEIVLGKHYPDPPTWTDACVSVIRISHADEITFDEAIEARGVIIVKLGRHLPDVASFDNDLALAAAYAATFPSEKSRQILNDVAAEQGP